MKTVYSSMHSKKIGAIIIAFCMNFFFTTFHANSQTTVEITTGTAGTPFHGSGPIYRSTAGSGYDASRYCYLYTAAELSTAGITTGDEISVVGWTKSNGTATTGAGAFRIYMKNSSAVDFSAATIPWATLNSGTTLVYQNLAQTIPIDSFPAYISFPLSTPFIYTGGSLEISTEWDISAIGGNPTTGTFSWLWSTVTDMIYGTGQTTLMSTGAATLSSTSNSITSIDDHRPFIQITFALPTGINPVSENSGLSIFPNPAADHMVVSGSSKDATVQLKMFNIAGELMLKEDLHPYSGSFAKEVEVKAFAPGMYFLQLFTGNDVVTRKVVIE